VRGQSSLPCVMYVVSLTYINLRQSLSWGPQQPGMDTSSSGLRHSDAVKFGQYTCWWSGRAFLGHITPLFSDVALALFFNHCVLCRAQQKASNGTGAIKSDWTYLWV
jgi:hypothetical protein